MAKQLARLNHFFEGKRRKCNLRSYHALKSKAGEHRFKLDVVMPLSHMPVDGMPAEFIEQYALMEKEKSALNMSRVAVTLDGALFSIFTTDTVRNSVVKINAATLQDFRLTASGVEQNRNVSLEFIVYLPATIALRDWVFDHLHGDFFSEAVPSQMELTANADIAAKGPGATPRNSSKRRETVQ